MVRKKSTETPAPANPNVLELREAIQSLNDQVEKLAGHVQIVHDILDEIREDLEWAVRNDRSRSPRSVMHITSMPLDPLAEDFGERVNRFTAADLPPDLALSSEDRSEQRGLFD